MIDLACPIDGCAETIPSSLLMCRAHWRRVPGDLQREVYAAWKARLAGAEGARERHQEAKDAAIHAVEGR